jgi:hypothetical protein
VNDKTKKSAAKLSNTFLDYVPPLFLLPFPRPILRGSKKPEQRALKKLDY